VTRTAADRVDFWRHPGTGIEVLNARFLGHAYDRHAHSTYAIGVTLEGQQGFSHRGIRHVSTPGTVIAMNPEEAHDGAAAGDDGFAYWMLYPAETRWRSVLEDAGERRRDVPYFTTTLIRDPTLAAALARLCGLLCDATASSLATETATVETLVALARRHGGTPPPAASLHGDDAVRRVRDFLHSEYARDLRLDDLARVAGRSRFRVTRAFAAAYGLPPHAYLTRRRLEAARERLAAGEPAALVAADVGFADQSHLIRRFKASYGITPGQFQAACTGVQS
jgi:AraC-like DNA-binding protein